MWTYPESRRENLNYWSVKDACGSLLSNLIYNEKCCFPTPKIFFVEAVEVVRTHKDLNEDQLLHVDWIINICLILQFKLFFLK